MGEKWVFYITAISVRVDRAKTLNPLFNLLDQFSSTYIPLRKCRIITGFSHFILIFIHKKKEKSLTRADWGLFVTPPDGTVMTQSARFTEAALTFRLIFSKHLIVYQQLTSCLGEDPAWMCARVRLRFLRFADFEESLACGDQQSQSQERRTMAVSARELLACQTKWQHTYVAYALINVILALLA